MGGDQTYHGRGSNRSWDGLKQITGGDQIYHGQFGMNPAASPLFRAHRVLHLLQNDGAVAAATTHGPLSVER